MNIKKLNEELEKFIINELDKSTMDNAFHKRADAYINAASPEEEEDALNKLTNHKDLRNRRNYSISTKNLSVADILGKDLTGEKMKRNVSSYKGLFDLLGYLEDYNQTPYDGYDVIHKLTSLKGLPKIIPCGLWLNGYYIDPKKSSLIDKGDVERIEGDLRLDFPYLNLNGVTVTGTLILNGSREGNYKVIVKNLPNFSDVKIQGPIKFDEAIPLVTGNCFIWTYKEYDIEDIIVPKHIKGNLILDLESQTIEPSTLFMLEGIQIDGQLILEYKETKGNAKKIYSQLKNLNLLEKLKDREKLEKLMTEGRVKVKSEPIEFKPDMTEYTREEDNVTFKIGDIVTCPSPGEFEIINIFPKGHVYAGKIVGPAPYPDWTHVAQLKNIKTKRMTYYSMMYLKKIRE